MASIVIPAVDAAAREQAKILYAGHFESQSVEATTEIDVESLKLTRLIRDGKDILRGLEDVWVSTAGQFLPAEMLNLTGTWRLYPAEVVRERDLKTQKSAIFEEDWRLAWGVRITENGNPKSDLPGGGISAGDCLLWVLADWLYYGHESVDRLVFAKDGRTGHVLGLEVPFLRSGLMERAA